jgi:hypothetical protein
MSEDKKDDKMKEDEAFYILYTTFAIICIIIFIWLMVSILNDDDATILDNLSDNEDAAEK